MSFWSFIAGIPGAISAIESLVNWLSGLVTKMKLTQMQNQNASAISDADKTHDQTPIENAIQSPTAGKPSGVPGSVIVSGPPSA